MTAAKRILVVDDDDALRARIVSILREKGYEVLEAPGGRSAQGVLGLEKVDLVISDVRMPDGGGIELLHWVKKSIQTPFVLITGFSELLTIHEAHEIGASDFLAKPFRQAQLLEIAAKWTGSEPGKTSEAESTASYCRMSIDDFMSGSTIRFDVFIRLSKEKFVKIAHKGDMIPIDRIRAYKDKDVRYLFMSAEDFREYVKTNLLLSKVVTVRNLLPPEKKRHLLKHTSEVVLESIYVSGVDRERFLEARTCVETVVSSLTDEVSAFNLLDLLNQHADFVYAHSLAVSVYGVLIARELTWTSEMTFAKVALGGLLHDIGKREVPRETLLKPIEDLTEQEIEGLRKHPLRGAEVLREIDIVPSDVYEVVLQHHENCLGGGYPFGLKKSRIHPLARLISATDAFCNYAIHGPNRPAISPDKAIQKLREQKDRGLDSEYVDALARAVGVGAPKA